MMLDTNTRLEIQSSAATRTKHRFLWAGVLTAAGIALGLMLGGCQSSRSVTVYVNGAVAANAEETAQFFYVPGAVTQRAAVKADGSATASQGIEHEALAGVANTGIIAGTAIAIGGGLTPASIAGGAAVAGAGVLAARDDAQTTGTEGRP